MKKRKRILSLFVTFCTFFALLAVPRSAAMSAEPDDAVGVLSLPDIITEAEAAENGYVARVSAAETNLNTLVFRNADGTNTMRIFDHPVKFEDGGTVKDITLGIKASRGGFVSAQSPIRTVFPSRLSDGISLTYDGIEIEMIPEAASRTGAAAVLSGDGKKVTYAYGNRTALEYTLTYTGFKEDIVVEEYTGQTDFDFTLRTNGLILVSENGSYYLRDAAGKTKAALGDIIIFTADERNNAFGSMTHKTVTAGQEYVITVHVDDEYLKDEKTAYPIRIDPTIEIVYDGTNASAIEDVTLNSLGSSAPNSGSIYVGKRGNYGISRTLMRFPGLDLSQIGTSDQIISARVELRDLMCYSTHLPVSCHIFQSNWNINTVNWSNASPNNYVSTAMDTKTVYYGNGDSTICGTQRYSFYITKAVKRWKDSQYTHPYGIIFKTTNEIETGNTNVSVCFASYNRASNKPSFTMVYSNPFVDFERTGFYRNNVVGWQQFTLNGVFANNYPVYDDTNLQVRANCYGYAMKMFCGEGGNDWGKPFKYTDSNGIERVKYNAYWQLPGEFWNKANSSGPSSYSGLQTAYTNKARNGGLTTSFVMNFIVKDMQELGYSISSQTKYTASTLPTDYYPNKRLVALVVSQSDFHFYTQNQYGLWSHKPGLSSATTACHCKVTGTSACSNPVDVLTNTNIIEHITDDYSDDYIFFYVSKPATIDYAHNIGTSEASPKTSLYLCDTAGNDYTAAKGIDSSYYCMNNGRIDYKGDVDFYAFDPAETKTYRIYLAPVGSSPTPANFTLKFGVYDSSMASIAQYTISNETTINLSFEKGKVYYFKIYSDGQTQYEYSRRYFMLFS